MNSELITQLGLQLYSSSDYWYKWAEEKITEPFNPDKYVRKNELFKKDEKIKTVLSTLTNEQKEVILELIKDTCEGVGFSIMNTLDQPPFEGSCKLTVIDEENNSSILDSDYDYHELWYQWAEKFKNEKELTNGSN